jgi:hypothetical protein
MLIQIGKESFNTDLVYKVTTREYHLYLCVELYVLGLDNPLSINVGHCVEPIIHVPANLNREDVEWSVVMLRLKTRASNIIEFISQMMSKHSVRVFDPNKTYPIP